MPQSKVTKEFIMGVFDTEKIKEQIVHHLKHVFDPEIPVNIYDLGLIYDIKLKEVEHYLHCDITMTLTSPGCPVAESLVAEVRYSAMSVNEVDEASVQLTFEPPWDMSKLSEEGRDLLIMNGAQIPSY